MKTDGSPEVFPTYVRGTGVGIASMLARVCAIVPVPVRVS